MKRLWFAAALAALVVVGFFFSRTKQPISITSQPQTFQAVLASATGSVMIVHNGTTTTAAIGQELSQDDEIRTGQDGEATIEFFSSARIALDKQTTLALKTVAINAAKPQEQQIALRLFTGRVWNRVLKLLDAKSSYTVEYNNVVAIVRGTAFLVTGQESVMTVDEFDGRIGFDGRTGELEQGRSIRISTTSQNQNISNATYFTSDEIRNDLWIRHQLRADADFAKRVSAIRQGLGGDESLDGIGNEAGPYTLDQRPPGVTVDTQATLTLTIGGKTQTLGTVSGQQETLFHSNYRGVHIKTPNSETRVKAGTTLALAADATFEESGALTTKDVTRNASWQILDEAQATIGSDGVLRVDPNATGRIQVIARYNDGTHEHSDILTLMTQ